MKSILLSLILSTIIPSSFAHEGHGHLSETLKAIHGGTVLQGNELNLEYITASGEVKIFPSNLEGKALKIEDITLSATVRIPRGKSETLELKAQDGAFVGKVDLKKSHRAEVIVTTIKNGKKDNFKFQVEK